MSQLPLPKNNVISVGQLGLKRTLIPDPKIMRLYIEPQDYLELNINSVYAGMTPDEIVRDLIKEFNAENRVNPKSKAG